MDICVKILTWHLPSREIQMVAVTGVIQNSSLTYQIPGLEELATGQQLSRRVAFPTFQVGASPQYAG